MIFTDGSKDLALNNQCPRMQYYLQFIIKPDTGFDTKFIKDNMRHIYLSKSLNIKI